MCIHCMCIYIYIVRMCVCVCVYIYIYVQNVRGRTTLWGVLGVNSFFHWILSTLSDKFIDCIVGLDLVFLINIVVLYNLVSSILIVVLLVVGTIIAAKRTRSHKQQKGKKY